MAHPSDDIDFYARAVRARWKWVIAFALLGGLIGWAYTSIIPPVYIAKATLLVPTIESKATPLGAFSPLNMLRGLVASIELQNRVSKELGLPRKSVESMLDSKAELSKNQLELTATSQSKDAALRVLQSANKHLRDIASEAGLGTAGRQATILQRAIEEREKELDTATKKLAAYQRQSSIGVDPTNPASALYYKAQLQDAKSKLGAIESQLSVRRTQAREGNRNAELPTGLTANLPERDALLAAEFAYETARRQLGDSNPELADRKAELDSARRRFESEVSQRFLAAAEGLDSDIAGLEARKAMLQTQSDFWGRLSKNAPRQAVELMKLNYEVEAISSVLKGLRDSYDDALQGSSVESVNWTILSQPRLQATPINKNFGLNLFLGVMLGLFVGGAISIVKFGA
ncbi:MAG: hypothetical protein JNK63_05465 [Chthonomonas sp.]|nr:hypothetical protein [Chthonomonas sp.]